MMDFCKHVKIGGVYIYVSSVRLKRRGWRDHLNRKYQRKLKRQKCRLYMEAGGCCMLCGREFGLDVLELHHIRPVSEAPELYARKSNLQLLCHDCHRRQHRRFWKGSEKSHNLKKIRNFFWRLRILLYLCGNDSVANDYRFVAE